MEQISSDKKDRISTPENLSKWRENKKFAPERARTHLIEHGFPIDFVSASLPQLENLLHELPLLIDELSFEAPSVVKNENRYVVRALESHMHVAQKYVDYLKAPESWIRA